MSPQTSTSTVLALALLTACGGTGLSAPTTEQCQKLEETVESAIGAYRGGNACSTDADCEVAKFDVSRNGSACAYTCPQVVAKSSADSYQSFLTNDPNITSSCEAFFKSGCTLQSLGDPPLCPSSTAQCSSSNSCESVPSAPKF